MAATVIINLIYGSSGGPTLQPITGTKLRRNAADAYYVNQTTNPILIPTSGTAYSFWACTRLQCTNAPSSLIDAIKWYPGNNNAVFGTGVGLTVATAAIYVQAGGTNGNTGDKLDSSNYSNLSANNVSAFTYNSASPLSVAGNTNATGQFGDIVVFQFTVANTASPGATPSETLTWQYNEV